MSIVLTVAQRAMETDRENAESLFLSVWNALHPFLKKRETELLKTLAPIVAGFLTASKSTLEGFDEATTKQVSTTARICSLRRKVAHLAVLRCSAR